LYFVDDDVGEVNASMRRDVTNNSLAVSQGIVLKRGTRVVFVTTEQRRERERERARERVKPVKLQTTCKLTVILFKCFTKVIGRLL
jgi:hypothetical protein